MRMAVPVRIGWPAERRNRCQCGFQEAATRPNDLLYGTVFGFHGLLLLGVRGMAKQRVKASGSAIGGAAELAGSTPRPGNRIEATPPMVAIYFFTMWGFFAAWGAL